MDGGVDKRVERIGWFRIMVMAGVLLGALVASGQGGETGPTGGPLPVPATELLGGKDRTLAFLATDKPLYRPGETLYARAIVLAADTFFPVREEAADAVQLILRSPRGDEIANLYAPIRDSVAGFAWKIPSSLAGGRYDATVKTRGGAPAARRVEIRSYAPPRLKSQIEFLSEGYGPGETVTAAARITRAEGGVPAGARVTAIARVDGREAARVENLPIDSEGVCRASFTLPGEMENGEGTLAFLIEDGGVVETASKTIPILWQTLDLAFYPEGGEFVAGLPGRLYVQARRPDGKPADIEGDVIRVDAEANPLPGDAVAAIITVHEGRGVTDAFTPDDVGQYALRLRRPVGVTRLFRLPPVRRSGAVLRAERDAYAFDEPIKLTIQATPDSGAVSVTLYQREKQVASAPLGDGENRIELDPGEAEGVLIATVWSRAGQPLAERLLFRRPKFSLNLGLTIETEPAGASPVPGGKVRLKVEARDENGRPVEAVVGVTITDDSLLEMVEKRDQAPSLPVMVYLENEVKDLADARVYFDAANPSAARDIDLILGVQGWRRFVLVRLDELLKKEPDAVSRILAIREPPPPPHMRIARLDARAPAGRVEEGMDFLKGPAPLKLGAAPNGAAAAGNVDAANDMGWFEEEIDEKAVAAAPMLIAPRREFGAVEDKVMHQQRFLAPEPEIRGEIAGLMKPIPLAVVREYAHQARVNRRPNDRVDFTETVYWNAGVRTNPRDGTAAIAFDLPDSVVTFKVRADAFANNGALGAGNAEIVSLEPFYIAPKAPVRVVAGDLVQMPVALVNSTGQTLDAPGLVFRSDSLRLERPVSPAPVEAGSRGRVILDIATEKAGEYEWTLNAAAGGYADSLTRTLAVLPRGFPIQQTVSGLLGPEKRYSGKFAIAADVLPGSLTAMAKIYPTPLANMEEALNALLRQPHGCFEQASSTNYPLVMAQQYFTSHVGASPERIRRAGELLAEGYKRLIGFECGDQGYEWFGQNPGHEALTAYGLLQFTEMQKVTPIDAGMINRTRNWLLSRRDGTGGFKRNEKALDSFGSAPVPLTNFYILWTLLEAGENPGTLAAEIAAAKRQTAASKDPYILALGANILYLAGDLAAARAAADAVRTAQGGDGGVAGAETSITRSGGESLQIETTSLAVMAWLRCGEEYAGAVERAMAWLFAGCKAGRFGSTQATILALKAINAYDAARAKPKAPGSAQLMIDGRPFGQALAFDGKSQGAMELPDFAAALTPGEHRVELVMVGGGEMPFALEIAYNSPQPADSPDCPLTLATALSTRRAAEGEPVDLMVAVVAGAVDVSMPLAVIGLPGGLEPRHERLKELAAERRIASYEILGRELVLYWRALKAGERIELTIPMLADIPGSYTAPASRVYAYYTDEHKRWVPGTVIEISPRRF